MTPFDAAAARLASQRAYAPRVAAKPAFALASPDLDKGTRLSKDVEITTPAGRLRTLARLMSAWGVPVLAADLNAGAKALEEKS